MDGIDLNTVLNQGSIVDNHRTIGHSKVTLKDILKVISEKSEGLKCAVGYFYLEGLALIIHSLRNLKEIKILMGLETTKLTKEELIKAFREDINSITETDENIAAVTEFHSLVKESKTLKARVYLGVNETPERLHSKAYIFMENIESNELLNRYKAGIVGPM